MILLQNRIQKIALSYSNLSIRYVGKTCNFASIYTIIVIKWSVTLSLQTVVEATKYLKRKKDFIAKQIEKIQHLIFEKQSLVQGECLVDVYAFGV